jgi:hypothetical protein
LEKLRAEAGPDIDFVLDGAGRLTPGDSASLATDLERFHLLWFDEPCRVSNLAALHKIASETVTPLGFGRRVHQSGAFQDLLREQVIDVLRPSLALNSLSQLLRIMKGDRSPRRRRCTWLRACQTFLSSKCRSLRRPRIERCAQNWAERWKGRWMDFWLCPPGRAWESWWSEERWYEAASIFQWSGRSGTRRQIG